MPPYKIGNFPELADHSSRKCPYNIQPGNVETPLLSTSTDANALKAYGEPSGAKVLEPRDIGRAVVYAVTQPECCAVNEILVEPREEPA